jgi:broad specificity phosphatase PhoE
MVRRKFISLFLCSFALVLTGPASGWSQSQETILYFTRHAQDMVALEETGKAGLALLPVCKPYLDDGQIDFCCLEVLNPLGEKRAELLAQWFGDNGLLPTLTHVMASYKTRTRQTVLPTAQAAGLDVNATDVDKNPGDGVQEIPAFVEECDDGFESASASLQPVVTAIGQLPQSSQALVCGHSGTLYKIMKALGIDTSDPVDFPVRPNGKVSGFNNLWIVGVNQAGEAYLKQHLLLDIALSTTAP